MIYLFLFLSILLNFIIAFKLVKAYLEYQQDDDFTEADGIYLMTVSLVYFTIGIFAFMSFIGLFK